MIQADISSPTNSVATSKTRSDGAIKFTVSEDQALEQENDKCLASANVKVFVNAKQKGKPFYNGCKFKIPKKRSRSFERLLMVKKSLRMKCKNIQSNIAGDKDAPLNKPAQNQKKILHLHEKDVIGNEKESNCKSESRKQVSHKKIVNNTKEPIICDNAGIKIRLRSCEDSSYTLKAAESIFKYLAELIENDNYLYVPDICPALNSSLITEYTIERLIENIKFKHNLLLFEDFSLTLWNKYTYFEAVNERICANWLKYWEQIAEDIQFINLMHSQINNVSLVIFNSKKVWNKLIRIPVLFRDLGLMIKCLCDDDVLNREIQKIFEPERILKMILLNDIPSCSQLMRLSAIIMKKICAPIRDSLIDGIALEADELGYCICFKKLVEFVELLRLDILNEFVRRYRIRVLQNIYDEEKNYFEKHKSSYIVRLQNFLHSLPDKIRAEKANSAENYVSLIYLQISTSSQLEKLPEPFSIDNGAIIKIYNEIQDATIISSLRVLLIEFFKTCKKHSHECFHFHTYKISLKRLLSNDKTTIGQIVSSFLSALECAVEGNLSNEQKFKISRSIDRILHVKSPIFKLFHKRIRVHIENILLNNESAYSSYKSNGTIVVLEEIRAIAKRIKELTKIHLRIHKDSLYSK